MATLSDTEKHEFVAVANSAELRHDMRIIRQCRKNIVDLDNYVEFLNVMNEMIGHRLKKFKPIKGELFLL